MNLSVGPGYHTMDMWKYLDMTVAGNVFLVLNLKIKKLNLVCRYLNGTWHDGRRMCVGISVIYCTLQGPASYRNNCVILRATQWPHSRTICISFNGASSLHFIHSLWPWLFPSASSSFFLQKTSPPHILHHRYEPNPLTNKISPTLLLHIRLSSPTILEITFPAFATPTVQHLACLYPLPFSRFPCWPCPTFNVHTYLI